MKVAVVGCGAIGSYYGAMLCRSGVETYFLLRSDYEAVSRNGVQVQSFNGDFRVHPRGARTPEEIGVSDLVLIGLKTTANDQFPILLPPLVGPNTAVMTLQNGLGNEEDLARIFPPSQILGGLCFVCLNRIAPGVVRHTAHGQIVIGELEGLAKPRTHQIAELFQKAGVPCKISDDLAKVHWEKLVWNIPFNGLGVAGAAGLEAYQTGTWDSTQPPGPCLTTKDILSSEEWTRIARELMMEVIGTARALGHDIPETVADVQLDRTRAMGAYKASTLLDFENGFPLELDSLFERPLAYAIQRGIPTPGLRRLCEILSPLERSRAKARGSR